MATPLDRRHFGQHLTLGGIAACYFLTPGAFAEELFRTASTTEGPFYPDKLPLDQDNDLIVIGNNSTPALGEVTQLSGRVLDVSGKPLKGLTVEIWQCDNNGVYIHSRDSKPKQSQRDQNFQGFGKFETSSTGEYRFRTIKPVPYPGRTPHIHVKVKRGDRELLTTQILIRGHQQNERDGVLAEAGDLIDRELLLADFKPIPDSKIGELYAKFDIVLGRTPADDHS